MCLDYEKTYCENCKRWQSGAPSRLQIIIFIFLSCLFLIPGIVYYFLAKPKSCYICQLEKKDWNNDFVEENIYENENLQSNNIAVGNNVNNNIIANQNTIRTNSRTTAINNNLGNKDFNNLRPLVEVRKLTKKYKGRPVPAVNDISFNIYPGEFHVFIGANGAGKTTTIKSIISAYSSAKYEGNILINGKSNETVAAKSLIGYIPEEAKFPKKMTTKTYLIQMARLSGYDSKTAKEITNNLLKKLNLEGLSNKCPDSFSSGQKKKILLAQALVHNPKILIMDEPAANLDPLARQELFDNLIELQREGKAIFLSSHILDEVGKYATYVTILDGGKIVYNNPLAKNENLSDLYYKYVKLGSVDTGIVGGK